MILHDLPLDGDSGFREAYMKHVLQSEGWAEPAERPHIGDYPTLAIGNITSALAEKGVLTNFFILKFGDT